MIRGDKKLYVIVRGDLSRSQRAVQAGHAVAEWCQQEASRWVWDGREVTTPSWRWQNGTLVYLKVADLSELEKLYSETKEAVAFREPDLNMQMTAVAVLGDRDDFWHLALA